MSFLDEPEETPSPPPRRPPPPPRGPSTDPQTVLMRRVMFGAGLVVLVLILFFGIRACADARQAQAFQDYVADVGALVSESNQQGETLFTLFQDPGTSSSVDFQNAVNGLRVEAEQLIERAGGIDTPKELTAAQDYLLETLSFRADGLRGVAEALPAALGDAGQREGASAVAGQMQNFLTSDVIYSQRVIPAIQDGATEANVLERIGTLPESIFLPDVNWLTEEQVLDAVTAIGTGASAGDGDGDEKASPGLHGTGLEGVTVQPDDKELTEGGTTVISESPDLSFDVAVQNQGESTEDNVPVRVTIEGGDAPVDLAGQIEAIQAEETVAVTIPVTEALPVNLDLDVTVEVEAVPGEESTDNNKGEYTIRVGS